MQRGMAPHRASFANVYKHPKTVQYRIRPNVCLLSSVQRSKPMSSLQDEPSLQVKGALGVYVVGIHDSYNLSLSMHNKMRLNVP